MGLTNSLQGDIKLGENLVKMTPEERKEFLLNLSDEEIMMLEHCWYAWARPAQRLPEQAFRIWLIQAGRGWGKSRVGAETVRMWKEMGFQRIALVGITPADARDVMILGESGLLACCPPWDMPEYQPTRRRVVWPNGSVANIYSGSNPEQLRGPQQEKAWCDEIFAWQYPQETWDMLMFGLRLGKDPQVVVTSTPKPFPLLKWMRAQPTTLITHGTTYDNKRNLASSFYSEIVSKYEGTRLGRQEINAEVLDDNPNAMWNRELIAENRVIQIPTLKRIIVAIDPAVTCGKDADETGIIVAGLGKDNHGYVLTDASLKGKPIDWANAAIAEYHKWKADRIVAEANNGGDMIELTISSVDNTVAFKKVHATKGKVTRAEPIAALYEKHRIHHVGTFGTLEDQMCEWEPGSDSPDHLDAMVWAMTELMLTNTVIPVVAPGSSTGGSKWR